jgi:hypothetical protein
MNPCHFCILGILMFEINEMTLLQVYFVIANTKALMKFVHWRKIKILFYS